MKEDQRSRGGRKIGARLHDLVQSPQELNRLDQVPELQTAQLALSKVACEPENGFTSDQLLRFRDALRNMKIDISALSCYINPLSENFKQEQQKFCRYVDYASIMGVGVVATETGTAVSDLQQFRQNHTEEIFLRVINRLVPIVEYASERGVRVGIESVVFHPVCDARRFRQMKDYFGNKICSVFDPVNLLYSGNWLEQERIFENFIAEHAADIRIVHLKDFSAEGAWTERPLFEGEMNVHRLLELFERYGVCADLIVENARGIGNYRLIAQNLELLIGSVGSGVSAGKSREGNI